MLFKNTCLQLIQEQIALKLADAGIAWKKLSDSEKEPFMEMARKDKERYLKEMHERDLNILHYDRKEI